MQHGIRKNGTVYGVAGGKLLADGTVFDVAGGRTRIHGTGYGIPFGTELSSLAVGEAVYLNIGGAAAEFLIVQQGLPSATYYDSSCSGTWLLTRDIYTTQKWDASDNDYQNADIHAYLNGTFLGLLDSGVQSAVKQVKIPYWNGMGSGGKAASGASGLSAKVFLLSCMEVGCSVYDSNLPTNGAKLAYFTSASASSANSRRVAYYQGEAASWWLRDPHLAGTSMAMSCNGQSGYAGMVQGASRTIAYGVRPALILPDGVKVDADGTLIV